MAEDTDKTPENENIEKNEEQEEKVVESSQLVTIEPLSDVELFQHALNMIQTAAARKENVAKYYRYLQLLHFGEEVSQEEATNATLEDDRQQALVADFLRDKLTGIKSDAISLDKKSINSAFENIFGLTELQLDAENTKESYYDRLFFHRAGRIPDLLADYQILQLSRDVAEIYSSKSGTTELNSKIMQMEDYYSNGDINREQMAQFYYNIGMIYEVNSVQKNTSQAVYREHFMALSYERKALDMTNTNINLILNVHKDWQDSFDYNPQKILDACHRVIDNSTDPRDVYRAHKLYADTLLDYKGTDGFSSKKEERLRSVVKHYRSALEYTQNKDEKIDVLNAISEQQKISNKPAYVQTRLELAELLTGRARIRECEKISDVTDDMALKQELLKASINEFHELEIIDDEDRRLYNEIDEKLRKVLPDDDNKVEILTKLDILKAQYGIEDKNKRQTDVSMKSSAGFDFFAAHGKGIND
ncbi:MAG: hypothetical protein IKN71_07215 [Alphaproteobacteria bacterium]|jgi:hypothetical protein|nr:hypothetical protein [Alphaproteobacteria bacterium]